MEIKGLKIHFTDQQKQKIIDEVKDILDSGQLAVGNMFKPLNKIE